jgi:plasmid stabilization system protein ParE
LVTSTRHLEHSPLIGPVVPEFQLENLRELIVEKYRVLYLVREDVCTIVAVIHGSRDLTQHFRPEDVEQ